MCLLPPNLRASKGKTVWCTAQCETILLIADSGVLVEDAAEAHRQATSHGAKSALKPKMLKDEASGTEQVVAEVELYGDVVLRFVSGSFQVSCPPNANRRISVCSVPCTCSMHPVECQVRL